MSTTNWQQVAEGTAQRWDASIVPALTDYMKVPNQSPEFDPEWATNGLMEKAFNVLIDWLAEQRVPELTYDYHQEEGRTPFLLVEIAGTGETSETVLMYGHMDKQPPLLPWDEGLGPYSPVLRDGKLYGRGGADDGYALCCAVESVAALKRNNVPHARVVIVIEACEESGSLDLDYYMEMHKARIGTVGLMICLDSGCLNYDQVWLTTSLRGIAGGVLRVRTLAEAMHSGIAGGVVPDTFRVARQLLDRLEDASTGDVRLPEAHCDIPAHVEAHFEDLEAVPFTAQFPTLPGVVLDGATHADLGRRNFWRPSVTVTGDNLPDPATAGNVIRPETAMKISLRLPPLAKAGPATAALGKLLTADPPSGAAVSFEPEEPGDGCAMPPLKPWLHDALNAGSAECFGKPYASQGMGGAIPFMAMLVEAYPNAQFVVTGVLGPKSNAHGPNEFLHVPFTKKLTTVVSRVVAAHYQHLSALAA